MANNNNNNNNNDHPSLKIISDCFIKPKFESKIDIHYLSSNDLFHLSTFYTHKGLLYAKPPTWSSSLSLSSSFNINTFVDNLKQSLSLALVEFYPLSGRLETVKYTNGDHSSWVYVDCNKGPGARFIHATITEQSDLTLSNIVTCHESIPRFLWCLFDSGDANVVNHDGHSRALLSVQVTELVDGIFIGFTMNHCLGDGKSFWCFVNTLSKIFTNQMSNDINNNNNNNNNNNTNNTEKPIFKAIFSDGMGPIIKVPYVDPSEFIVRPELYPRLRIQVFHFNARSITKLKAQANEKSDVTISSFQALSAFTWISINRVRNQPDDSDTDCWVIADTRSKLDPPLSPNHFGNFINNVRATSKKKELLSSGLGRASLLVREAVMGLDSNVVRANLKARDETPQVAQLTHTSESIIGDDSPLVFGGSMRYDSYGPEFGFGQAVATRPGYPAWVNGLIIVDPGREGGGSANLHICLSSKTMDVLERDNEFMSYVS